MPLVAFIAARRPPKAAGLFHQVFLERQRNLLPHIFHFHLFLFGKTLKYKEKTTLTRKVK